MIMTAHAGAAAQSLFTGHARRPGDGHDGQAAAGLAVHAIGSEEELDAYVMWLYHRVRGLLRRPQHWAAIQALAAELIVRRRVGAPRARRVIRSAMRGYVDAERAKRPPVKIIHGAPTQDD